MIDIKTQYAGLTLRNPIIVGSSGLTNKDPPYHFLFQN